MQSRSTLSNPSATPAQKITIFDRTRKSRDERGQKIQNSIGPNFKPELGIYQRTNSNEQSDCSNTAANKLAKANNIYCGHNDLYQRGSPSTSIYQSDATARNLRTQNCIASSTSIQATRLIEPSFMVDRLQKTPIHGSSGSLHCSQTNIPKSARDHIAIHEAGQPDAENSEPVTRPRFQSTFAFQKKVAQQTKDRMSSFSPAAPNPADRSNFKLEIEISSLQFRIKQLETHSSKQAESRPH
jgi:hypothetical protein